MSGSYYFGTDGIRGTVGKEKINPLTSLKLGWSAGRVLAENCSSNTLIIGKDTRVSGYMIESALVSGILSAGVNIKLLGPMPTPAISYLTHTFRASGGIVISASHNPYYDNGVKFFDSNGRKISSALERKIEEQLVSSDFNCSPSSELGKVIRIPDAYGRYIEYCKSHFLLNKNLRGLKLVVDCANGATYNIAPSVFHELGAEVIPISIKPDGFNINKDCGATYPELISREVLKHKADLGLSIDGDGDRLVMSDHLGNIADGDDILYIWIKDLLLHNELNGGVVGTVMSNLSLEMFCKNSGVDFIRSSVGDKNVVDCLINKGWLIGGEPSGHLINLNYGTTGDSIISAILVLKAMLRSGKSLNESLQGFVKTPRVLKSIACPSVDYLSIRGFQQLLDESESSLQKINGRLLVRKSGTEDVLRVLVESVDLELNQLIFDRFEDIILSNKNFV